MGLRELKMERTRALIAEKAFELFTTQGFEHTTIEQIAAAAEVGPRTLYRYFPTKEALIVNFVDIHLTASLDSLRAQPDDTPLASALYALVESVITSTTENAERVLAVYELAARTPSVQAQFSGLWSAWREACAAEVTRRHRGKPGDMCPSLAAATTMVVIDVCVRHWVESGGRANMRRLVNKALDLLRSGEVPIATP
ncbi:TetR/AcrR family transcriptional regulator [Actinocrispum sp. NPDC049592]|uniref:TetR/AcrR family transcriptional regulator n=1 Tax=Actinocrispum sp. NPDC049592 TaxID=3154835 RepID=UPI00342F1AD6